MDKVFEEIRLRYAEQCESEILDGESQKRVHPLTQFHDPDTKRCMNIMKQVLSEIELSNMGESDILDSESQQPTVMGRKLFGLPPDEALVQHFSSAYKENYFLVEGRLYLFNQSICFYSNQFSSKTKKTITFDRITNVREVKTAETLPDAIEIIAGEEKHLFSSFIACDCDKAFKLINDGLLQYCRNAIVISEEQEPRNIENVDRPNIPEESRKIVESKFPAHEILMENKSENQEESKPEIKQINQEKVERLTAAEVNDREIDDPKIEIVDSKLEKVDSEISNHNIIETQVSNEEKDEINVDSKISGSSKSKNDHFLKAAEFVAATTMVIHYFREMMGLGNADLEKNEEEGSDPSGSKKPLIVRSIALAAIIVKTVHQLTSMAKRKKIERNSKRRSINAHVNESDTLEAKPKSLCSGITYQVVDEGEGQGISKYQQVCFRFFNQSSSPQETFFEGTPIELAIKLSRESFYEVPTEEGGGVKLIKPFEEAIEGMKLNGRRIIIIPPQVTGLDDNKFLDLTLTIIDDLKPRKPNTLASKL